MCTHAARAAEMDNVHNLTDTTLGEHICYLKERIDRDTEVYQRQVSILNNWYSSVDAKRNAQWGVRYYNQSIYRWMQELSDLKRRLLHERERSGHTARIAREIGAIGRRGRSPTGTLRA